MRGWMNSPCVRRSLPGKHLHAACAARKGGAENVDFDRTVPAKKNDIQRLPFFDVRRPENGSACPPPNGPSPPVLPRSRSHCRAAGRLLVETFKKETR